MFFKLLLLPVGLKCRYLKVPTGVLSKNNHINNSVISSNIKPKLTKSSELAYTYLFHNAGACVKTMSDYLMRNYFSST